MRPLIVRYVTPIFYLFLCFFIGMGSIFAQEEDTEIKKKIRPVSNTFESIWLIDNQTVMVPYKGTFEMDMLHRFGTIKNGYEDFWGLYASGNIRIGFNYVPMENVQLGFGFTKERLLWDLNGKYAILRQGREGGSPLSVTYYVNMGIDTRDGMFHEEFTDRLTYFHQLMVARKLTDKLSLQSSISISHFNFQELSFDDRGELTGRMNADHLGLALMGRYMVTDVMGLLFNADFPLSSHAPDDPKPNLSFGVEFTTSSHGFQIFLGNYQSIMPQYNNSRNLNDPGEGEFVIGFNITRLWNF